jgi:hypothetical protein
MNRYVFQLHITAEQYLDYYRGMAHSVVVRATSGQIVQFPAARLQRFVTTEGVHGSFVLVCDDQNKFVELQRLPAGPS